jgi:hypothetical protein
MSLDFLEPGVSIPRTEVEEVLKHGENVPRSYMSLQIIILLLNYEIF